MKKLFAVVAVLCAVRAYAGGGSIVVCESMTACRERLAFLEYDIPTLTLDATDGGLVNISAALWLSHDCSGDPDDTMYIPNSPIPSAGHWYLWTDWIFEDGTDYSIQWTIDGCPTTACTNGTTGKSPDICK